MTFLNKLTLEGPQQDIYLFIFFLGIVTVHKFLAGICAGRSSHKFTLAIKCHFPPTPFHYPPLTHSGSTGRTTTTITTMMMTMTAGDSGRDSSSSSSSSNNNSSSNSNKLTSMGSSSNMKSNSNNKSNTVQTNKQTSKQRPTKQQNNQITTTAYFMCNCLKVHVLFWFLGERELKSRIRELVRCRRNGITKLSGKQLEFNSF